MVLFKTLVQVPEQLLLEMKTLQAGDSKYQEGMYFYIIGKQLFLSFKCIYSYPDSLQNNLENKKQCIVEIIV